MTRAEAADLLEQAAQRLKKAQPNANGGAAQTGGAYWRVAQVLEYLDSCIEPDEGLPHARFLRCTHGRLVRSNTALSGKPARSEADE